ncbi:MAG TPA: hypothetical protein VGK59_03515 [Ohtaekwangia sp.]
MLWVIGAACSNTMDESSFVQWVTDYENGLHVRREAGDYIVDVQYMPEDFKWLQYRDQPRQQDDQLQYYTVTIQPKIDDMDLIDFNIQNEAERQQRLYYFSYSFQNDLMIEENGQALPCVLYHFERPADMKNSRTFLLAFEKHPQASQDVRLVINSRVLGSLPVNIKINKSNIPALAL